MNNSTARLLPWLASMCLLAASGPGHSQTYSPFEAPPQHRALRADTTDTTPMTVVPSTDTFYGQGWHWVPIDGAKCRQNANTGIAVRLRPAASKIVITMQGGGACLTSGTCMLNPAEFGLKEFQASTSAAASSATRLYEGIWKISSLFGNVHGAAIPNMDTPNRLADDYSEVFIPYCSGDLHVGARQNAAILFVAATQNFQGMANTELYYRYIVDQLLPRHFSAEREVVLTGYSAGGYGALLTAAKLRDMLPANVGLTVVADSSPPFQQTTSTAIPALRMALSGTLGSPYQTLLRPCMQQRLHDVWGLANSVLRQCGAACNAGNWMNPMFDKLLKERPDVFVALTSSTYDATSRYFMWSPMDANCAWEPNEAQFTEGLLKLRAQMQSTRSGRGNTASYFISTEKTGHVVLSNQRYYNLSQATGTSGAHVRLQDWMQEIIYRPQSGLPLVQTHVGP